MCTVCQCADYNGDNEEQGTILNLERSERSKVVLDVQRFVIDTSSASDVSGSVQVHVAHHIQTNLAFIFNFLVCFFRVWKSLNCIRIRSVK